MHKLRTSTTYMYIGIDAPEGTDPATYPCEAALIADDGTEPGETDWHPASWIGGQVALLIGPGPGATDYPAGEYFAYARISAGQEQPVLPSGRVRVGLAPGT